MNTDSAIIARSIVDPSAFGEVFLRHAPRIHRFVARRVSQPVADDIISETFLIAFERRARNDQTFPDCAPWLFGIATNLMSRHRVQEARTYKLMERSMGREGTEEDHFLTVTQIDAQLEVARLAGVLRQLKPRDRDVLLLFAWEDLSYEQIAAALSIPVGVEEAHIARTQAGRESFTRQRGIRSGKLLFKRPVLSWSLAATAGLTAITLIGLQLFGAQTSVQAAPILYQAAANARASNEPDLVPGKYMQLMRLKPVQSGIFDSDYRLKPGPKNHAKMFYVPANEDGSVTIFLPAYPEEGEEPFSFQHYQYQFTEVDTQTAAVLDQIAQIPTASGKDALEFVAGQHSIAVQHGEDADSPDVASFIHITDLLATGLVPSQTRAASYLP